jgi:hypothetical protein
MSDSAGAEPRSVSTWINPRRKRFWAVVALVAYAVLGFLVAPWIARGQIVELVSTTLNRPVELDELRLNPFALSAEAAGFRVSDTNGAPLVGFERLYANLQLSSVFRRALVFRELRLDRPRVNLVRDETAAINLLDVYEGIGADADPQAGGESALPGIVIGELDIADGIVDVTDRALATPFTTEIAPINIGLANVSTRPNETGEQRVSITSEGGTRVDWTGSLQVTPLAVAGNVTVTGPHLPLIYRYFRDQLNFSVADGTVDVTLDYRLELPEDDVLAASIENLSGRLADIVATANDRSVDILRIPEIRLRGGYLHWPGRRAGAESLEFDGLAAELWRDADGNLSLTQLLAAETAPRMDNEVTDEDPGAAPDEAGPADTGPANTWDIALESLRLTDARAGFTDEALREPARVEIPNIDFSATQLTIAADAEIPVTLGIDLADRGRIDVEGRLIATPAWRLETGVAIGNLALSTAQPWLADAAFLRILDGVVSAQIDATIGVGGDASVTGSASIMNLDIEDTANEERLLGWSGLDVNRFAFSGAPTKIEISEVAFAEPFVRLLIAADGSTNFSGLARGESEPSGETGDTPNIEIGRVTIADGSADFTDQALPFPFEARVRELQGEVSTLATQSAAPTKIGLEGKVGEFGFARLDGSLLPAEPTAATNINVLFRNVEFPGLSPYTVKFAGRRIEEGRLEVALDYSIDGGELVAQNSIVIQRIRLGEKVDYPGAMNLPLGLAIALLQDPSGQINVDLPVRGNVNDPEFSVGGVVLRAFANLITKAATSPFRLLGGLVGADSENFDRIEFEPGQADLTPPEREKLGQLGSALAMRPALGLTVPGAIDPEVDARAMRAARIDAKIDALLETDDDAAMIAERRRKAIEKIFRDAFPEQKLRDVRAGFMQPVDASRPDGKQSLDELAYVEELRARLVAGEPIDRADLDALATARTDAVVAQLTTAEPPVATERIVRGDVIETQPNERGFVPVKLELGK